MENKQIVADKREQRKLSVGRAHFLIVDYASPLMNPKDDTRSSWITSSPQFVLCVVYGVCFVECPMSAGQVATAWVQVTPATIIAPHGSRDSVLCTRHTAFGIRRPAQIADMCNICILRVAQLLLCLLAVWQRILDKIFSAVP